MAGGARAALRDVAGSVLAPTALAYVGQGAVAPVLALLAVQRGASTGQAAFVVAALGVGTVVGAAPAGLLAARFGDRRVLIGSSIVVAGCFLVAALASTVWALAALLFTAGVASAAFDIARQAYVAEVVPVAFRGRVMSTLGGAGRGGLFLGPLLGAAAQTTPLGLRGALLVGTAASLSATIPLLLSQDRSTPGSVTTAGRGDPPSAPAASLRAVARRHRRTLLGLGSSMAVIAAARAVRPVLVPLWAVHVGLSATTTSLLFALSGAVEFALFYPAGSLLDRVGRRAVAVPCSALMGVGLVALTFTSSLAPLAVAVMLVSLGSGLGSGIVKTVGADTAPPEDRAAFLGLWTMAAEVGGSGGPLLVAVVGLASLTAAGLTVGILALLAAAALSVQLA